MKRVVLFLAISVLCSTAHAQSRPSTPERSCQANRQSVLSSGAIVLGTGGYTYDRFVDNRGFCQFDEIAEPAWVPSRDTPTCFVGYRCQTRSRFRND